MRALAVLAVLVLVLGLQRVLVLCEHDGVASLSFAHAPGACCHDETVGHGFGRAADGDADHGDADHGDADHGNHGEAAQALEHCEHRGLAVELAPAPRPQATAVDPAPPCARIDLPTPPVPALRRAPGRPPATGPPRPDPRVALRATTQLLV